MLDQFSGHNQIFATPLRDHLDSVTGTYVNSALAKTEAIENGYDEAIMLNQDGHVSEGSGQNIMLVVEDKLLTPPSADNILLGITRDTAIRLARNELGMETVKCSLTNISPKKLLFATDWPFNYEY